MDNPLSNNELNVIRNQIDEVNNALTLLLEKRYQFLKEVITLKKKYQLPIYDEVRQNQMLSSIKTNEAESKIYVEKCMQDIFKTSLEFLKKNQI